MRRSELTIRVIAVVLCFAAPLQVAHAAQYIFTDLGVLDGMDSSSASDINAHGQVVGVSWGRHTSGSRHAFCSNGLTMTDIGTLGGTSSAAVGINDGGWVVGSYTDAVGTQRIFLHDGTMTTDLPTAGGQMQSVFSINNNGDVVGSAFFSLPYAVPHAFLLSGSTTIDLGSFGGDQSVATGVNNNHQVIVNSSPYNSPLSSDAFSRAFLYSDTSAYDIGTVPDGFGSCAIGINDLGQVVGYATVAGQAPPSIALHYSGPRKLDHDFESNPW